MAEPQALAAAGMLLVIFSQDRMWRRTRLGSIGAIVATFVGFALIAAAIWQAQ